MLLEGENMSEVSRVSLKFLEFFLGERGGGEGLFV